MKEIHEQVAQELNIPLVTVREIHNHKMKWLRNQMANATNIKIIDTDFGNYTISSKQLFKHIKSIEPFEKDWPEVKAKIDNYKSLIKRNIKLRYSRKNKLGVFRTENTIYG